ncbi:MAG: FAD-dependent oxidoreductase, partial [Gammaproteobacteria bacterium]
MDSYDILVVGGGPAGVMTALRLAGMGYRVAVMVRPRRETVWEGLSARAVEGLRAAGCTHALATLDQEIERLATWNGRASRANRERIVNR